jgi:glucose/mannose transport system substrate-binding protein
VEGATQEERMLKLKTIGLTAALAAFVIGAAKGEEQVVFTNWSHTSEEAALKVLRDAWEKQGHKWKDLAIAHDSGVNVSLINMITGGNPPTIFMSSDPDLVRDMVKQGLGFPLTKLYHDSGAVNHFPAAVLRNITVDGEIMKAPVTLHIDGMIYYNKHVADAVGVDPKSWKSLDDFFAVYDKIKDAGYVPLAQGGDKFQEAYLLQALIAAEAGPDTYNKFYGEKPDKAAIDSDGMRKALARFRQISEHVDPGSPNRQWNETTDLVITGKALMQIHGDWMKGEFKAAGKQLGVDFDCANIPGTKALVVTTDAFGFLKTNDPQTTKGEQDFALDAVDPVITAAFNAQKGATPVRDDVDPAALDACNKLVLDTLKDPNRQVPNPFNTADADWYRTIWDEADKFWSNKKETDAEFIKAMQDAYDQTH